MVKETVGHDHCPVHGDHQHYQQLHHEPDQSKSSQPMKSRKSSNFIRKNNNAAETKETKDQKQNQSKNPIFKETKILRFGSLREPRKSDKEEKHKNLQRHWSLRRSSTNKEEIFDKDISDKENNSSLSSNKVKGHLPSNQ